MSYDDTTTLSKTAFAKSGYLFPPPIFARPGSQVPLTEAHLKYRSHTITTPVQGLNPLVASASALLALASTLRETQQYSDVHALAQHLLHEVKAFEVSAQKKNYRADTILLARYLLCATLDDILLNTPWGREGHWDQHQLLLTFQNTSDDGERFFSLFDSLREDAALHIDSLELMYLCLSTGYEGKYRHDLLARTQYQRITDSLYRCIRSQRGEINKTLFIPPPSPPPGQQTIVEKPLSPGLALLLTASLLLTLYTGFSYLFAHTLSPVYQQLSSGDHPS